ncbi:MAG: hypothetical protein EBS53_00445 [Bacteroidetes bacterium]|nr:hypothetical protein [Bacteroidota bacterium]
MSIEFSDLEESFDNEKAEEILSLSLDKVTHTAELLRKSLYDFDLDTPEGIEKLMNLLPIMDPAILEDIVSEIWPGYVPGADAKRYRLEIRGYLKDYLESYDEQEANQRNSQEATSGGQGDPTAVEGTGTKEQASVAKDAGA